MTQVNQPANPSGPPPPPPKVWALEIEELKFTNDHALIKDNDKDWTKSGAAIPKPEWKREPPANGLVTYSRKTTVEADATFKDPLAKGDTVNATVKGRAIIPALSLEASAPESLGPGAKKTIHVKAGQPLLDLVGRIKMPMVWRAEADQVYPAGTSGPHTIYVTYDKPIDTGLVEDGVTVHRMKTAIDWIGGGWTAGKRKPVDLIEVAFSKFSGYTLGFDMLSASQQAYLLSHPGDFAKLKAAGFATFQRAGKGGAWPLAEFVEYGGECQAIVRLTRAMAHQVGLPGKIEVKYVSSQPSDPYQTRILDDPAIDPGGPIPGYLYALVDGPVQVGQDYGTRDGVGFNRYEAFLKYTDGDVTWFGGGIGRMAANTQESNLVKVFWGLVAMSQGGPDPAEAGTFKWKIERVWKY